MSLVQIIRRAADVNRRMCDILQKRFPRVFDYESYLDELLARIDRSISLETPDTVLEVGGIDRPLLGKGCGYRYDGLDIESNDACYEVYDNFIVQSIENPFDGSYGAIVSTTLLEHVPNNASAIINIFGLVDAGGVTHHYIPSKGHPYAMALRFVGPIW